MKVPRSSLFCIKDYIMHDFTFKMGETYEYRLEYDHNRSSLYCVHITHPVNDVIPIAFYIRNSSVRIFKHYFEFMRDINLDKLLNDESIVNIMNLTIK